MGKTEAIDVSGGRMVVNCVEEGMLEGVVAAEGTTA